MPARKPHILIVEDDAEISALMSRYLGQNEFTTSVAPDGKAMDRCSAQQAPDLIVLDLNLPDEDGLSLCRRLRDAGGPPIIMVTAKGEEIDRIVGLEMGADDYLPKPFNPRELLARIKAVLRRDHDGIVGSKAVAFAGWVLDEGLRRVVNPDGARIAVTSAEFDLLAVLCAHPNRALTRERLLELTQGPKAGAQGRSIDILVSRLRMKIESDPRDPLLIQTVRSLGYMLTAEVVSR